MEKYLLLLFTFCCSLLQTVAQEDSLEVDTVPIDSFDVQALPWPANAQARIDSVLAKSSVLETSQLGLMIYDLTADSALYVYGHRQTMRPASTMKLLTAITALDRLGSDYQMQTSLYYTGEIENGKLTGNIVCIGGMDPLFDRQDLSVFISKLRHNGIDTIQGRILTDISFKDADRLGEGWCWDDDNPVLSPLLVGRKDRFEERLRSELQHDGVVVIDSMLADNRRNMQFVCSRSHGVDELLVRMMKESDNLYAESLFYQLAHAGGHRPATGKQAAAQVRRMIQKVGLNSADYRVADGSGLSLYNYVSAELETMLLRYAWKHDRIYRRLYPVLPVAGVDGTLKKRMTRGKARGNVHAKTGTLTGIVSLAGYCTAANGHELAFSIISQGVLRSSRARAMIDRICEAMCD